MRRQNPAQLSLFQARKLFGCEPGKTPAEAFVLAPSPDEIRICSGCGRQIITQRHTAGGQVVSEFVSAAGECFACK